MNNTHRFMLFLTMCTCLLAFTQVGGAIGLLPSSSRSPAPGRDVGDAVMAPRVSLCGKGETVVFSCVIKSNEKLLSLCGSRDLDANHGYVQYRFGRQGKLELEFPTARVSTQSAFIFSRYTRPLVTFLSLKFETGGYFYEVHQDSNDEEKPPVYDASVSVAPAATNAGESKEVVLRCRMPVEGSLMKLEDIVTTRPWLDENQ